MAVQQDTVISIKGNMEVSQQTLYTVPLGRTCIICDWFVNNTSDENVTVTVTMGGVSMIPGTVAIPHSKYVENNSKIILTAGDSIEIQSSSPELSFFFSGIEQDVSLY